MKLKTEKVVVEVKRRLIEFNETLAFDDNGDELFIGGLEQFNDLKLYEEYERVTGEKLLKTKDYSVLSDVFN